MGTQFRIVFYAGAETDASAIAKAAFGRIADLDACMSDYSDTSELTRLCRDSKGISTPISEDLFRVLERSIYFAQISGGAFDATCGPAVRQWRRARRQKQLPTNEQIAHALERVGYKKLRLDPEKRSAQLLVPQMQLDLGGIAKGYACDEALAAMKKLGVTRALVDGGGGLGLGDPPPGKKGWEIKIASHPGLTNDTNAMQSEPLVLHNCGVATSGDAEQFIEIDGVRYSHIVDPRTGVGLTNRYQATVIALSGMDADALTKVACVLGPKEGFGIIDQVPAAAARLVQLRPTGIEEHLSKEWRVVSAK